MLFATAKSYLFFSLFSLISSLEKSRWRFREQWRVKREKWRVQKEKAAFATFLFGGEEKIRTPRVYCCRYRIALPSSSLGCVLRRLPLLSPRCFTHRVRSGTSLPRRDNRHDKARILHYQNKKTGTRPVFLLCERAIKKIFLPLLV